MSITGLTSFSFRLTKARFAAGQGEALLYSAGIVAYTVCAALALTVAGGTWMFYHRWQRPTGLLAQVVAEEKGMELVAMFYVMLALIACALLIPSVISLATGAAVLGARGRERRLSALRLLGLSSGDITRMSLIDTSIQAALGCIAGLVLYLATLPLWGGLELEAMRIDPAEMLLPAWVIATISTILIAAGLGASWWGLRRIRITPLGVARRSVSPKVKAWRLVAFLAILIGSMTGLQAMSLGREWTAYIIMAGIMVLMVWGLNLVGPFILQCTARVVAMLPGATAMWAGRRVAAFPKTTWSRVAGIGLLALIAGYVSRTPIEINATGGQAAREFVLGTQWDFTKGAIITLGVGLILTATSILISQASAVFERAEQSVALHKMGTSPGFLTRVAWLETLGPVIGSVLLGYLLGIWMASPIVSLAERAGYPITPHGTLVVVITLTGGLALAVTALLLCQPLQARLLREQHREND